MAKAHPGKLTYGTGGSGTPEPVVEKLRAALIQAMATPEVSQRLRDEGANLESSTPGELAAFIRAEIDK